MDSAQQTPRANLFSPLPPSVPVSREWRASRVMKCADLESETNLGVVSQILQAIFARSQPSISMRWFT